MNNSCFRRFVKGLVVWLGFGLALGPAHGQTVKQNSFLSPIPEAHTRHVKERDTWFFHGRIIPGMNSADLRHRAYRSKMELRARRSFVSDNTNIPSFKPSGFGAWTPLGPVPLASDASGTGVQDYHQVSGRATAVVIDPADPTGNTVFVGGAQGGIWRSLNAANPTPTSVAWSAVAEDAATLSVGSIAIQPGNTDPTKSVILVGTGEADNASDSYYGLGMLRSADGGNTWSLNSAANSGALSFAGLGGTRMAFGTVSGLTNTVVSAMATANEGLTEGTVTNSTQPGLYTSLDAGQTWTYDALIDPGNQPTDATSATSVVYNSNPGMFLAAVRYHGLYSSIDGVNWTRLTNQPGAGLSTDACPPIASSNGYACPIFRAEIAAIPNHNEYFVWIISLDGSGNPVDGGIWQTLDAGNSWTAISETGIANCGDFDGCGVEQGFYNLSLMAMPNGSATDLYAGAVNLYKCSISVLNPTCNNSPFLNLTHVYGCDPIAAPSHVHPAQHAMAYAIPTGGSDLDGALIYFANDGGIYRALNGYAGLSSGSCSVANQFDDLNQNLGSMTQFVSFSQDPTNIDTLLGGAQGNGSPGTANATVNLAWGNVNGGDGGFNAIDPNTPSNWFVSNPDVPPGGLNIQECSSGSNCHAQNFNVVVASNDVGGDDGALYFPYALDPQSGSTMIVGTCRVWRGPRLGGAFTALSSNFDTLGDGTCIGTEVNLVRALAAGGPTDSNGSTVIYVTTDGAGPLTTTSPSGGNVWVTTNATAGVPAFTEVAGNINPNFFPVSSVAIDSSDATGKTAYVAIMGFTGSAGHVWQTKNAGATWTDFSGSGGTGLPDAPANAVIVDASTGTIFVGTDVGVFASNAGAPNWSEVGVSGGFLPNVVVTALAIFNSGGQKFLRASTYGRGVWQANLNVAPDYQLAISNSPLIQIEGQSAAFNGAVTALNGYSNSITLSCTTGTTAPPTTCVPTPPVLNSGSGNFSVGVGGVVGDYFFNITAVGSDGNNTTHQAAVVLHITSNAPDFILSGPGSTPDVKAGSTTSQIPIGVTEVNNFAGTVSLTCSVAAGNGSCGVSPATVSSFPANVSVTVNATNMTAGSFQLNVQGVSGAIAHTLPIPINVADYQIAGPSSITIVAGAQETENLTITPSTFYTGNINASCDVTSMPGATCAINPANPIVVGSGTTVPVSATIGVPSNTAPGNYAVKINTQDTTGVPSHTFTLSVTVVTQDFLLSLSPATQTVSAGQSALYQVTVDPSPSGSSFSGAVTISCPTGLPAGTTCSITPSTPITSNGTAVLAIATSTSTSAGTYPFTITGTSASLTHSVSLSIVVSSPSRDFTLNATSLSGTSYAGNQATIALTLTSTSSTSIQVKVTCDDSSIAGALSCSQLDPPSPVTVSAANPVQLTAAVSLPNSVNPAAYPITFTAQDATGSQPPLTYMLTISPDFSLTNVTPPQTITAGQTTGAYQLTVAPNPAGSSFIGAVTLSCGLGLPPGAQCLFDPSTAATIGSSAVDVVLTISTSASTGSASSHGYGRANFYAILLVFPGIVIFGSAFGIRKVVTPSLLGFVVLFALGFGLIACASKPASISNTQQTTGAGTYTVQVVGTSGALSNSTSVGLVIE